jgi:prepilin-type processing-associated H-X9-DG protein
MIELLVVLSIVMVLTGLLMPGITKAKHTAFRLMCSSNMRQLGAAFVVRGEDHGGRLPDSHLQTLGLYEEMCAVNTGQTEDLSRRPTYDGLGLLWEYRYIDSAQCFYCPAHRHNHTYEADAPYYDSLKGDIPRRIYSNYHYTGPHRIDDSEPNGLGGPRSLNRPGRMILLTDSLRSREDFNHPDGMNVLYADCSTIWEADSMSRFSGAIPAEATLEQSSFAGGFWVLNIWDDLGIQN